MFRLSLSIAAVHRILAFVRLDRLLAVLFLVLVGASPASMLGCGRKTAPTTQTTAVQPVVNDGSEGLLLTWVDDKGEFHTEQRVKDVPESGREIVRVRALDPEKDPGTDRVFVADLRAPGGDGNYPVRLLSRADFEEVAVTRRAKHGSVLAPKAAALAAASAAASAGGIAGGPGPGFGPTGPLAAPGPAVIIYGASWCGPCHQAAAYLKQRGIAFVEHDIEQDSSAAREMQTKLAKAGRRGGSIPVLDVRGHILVGFDARAVDQALSASN